MTDDPMRTGTDYRVPRIRTRTINPTGGSLTDPLLGICHLEFANRDFAELV